MNTTDSPNIADLDESRFNHLPPNIQETLQGLFICPLVLCLSFVFLADKMHIPNQLLAMVYGSLVGLVFYYINFLKIESVFFWKPDNIIVLCHPIMLAKIAFSLDIYVFAKSKWQILIIATIGTGMFIGLFGFLVIVMTNRKVNLVNIVAAGTTLAAIDVPDVLMELNRIKNLEVVMDGESVFGAALCIMTYSLCIGYYNDNITTWYHLLFLYGRFVIVGLLVGYVIGKTACLAFRWFYQDTYNATMTVLASCYAAYYLCENYIYCSATICTFFVGYCMAKERYRLSPSTNAKLQLVIDNAYNAVEFLNCIVLSATVTYRMVKMYKGFDFAVAVGVYIMGNVLRIMIFLVLSPILSRLGLGFNTTTLLTISWAAKRGSLQLLQVIFIAYYDITNILGTELLCFTVVYLTLSFLINMTSLEYILKYFGLIEFTMARKYNITQCISMLMEKKHRVMFALKTNRLLSDLNWDLIHRSTMLNNPYASISGDMERANDFETTCPTCYKSIPYLSSVKIQHELIKDVRSKMLKLQRITLVRQFELGLLRRTELEIILQYIEAALNSNELKFPYNDFLELFNIDKTYLRWLKRLDPKKRDLGPMIWRRWAAYSFLRYFKQRCFIYVKLAVTIFTALSILIWLVLEQNHMPHARIALWIGYTMTLFYVFEIVVNMLCFKWKSLYSMYFRNIWNFIGLFLLLLATVAFISSLAFDFHYIRVGSILRILYFEQMGMYLVPFFHKLIEKRVDSKLSYAYCFGLAMVTSLEEVQASLHSICKIPNVREFISAQVQTDKMRIMERLAMVQYTRPHVAVTMSTFQLEMAILKTMYTNGQEIKAAGVVEEFEYRILQKMIENATKRLDPKTAVQLNSAKTMLREIPWMGPDDRMFEYLYSNIKLKLWENGEVICDKGDFIDGVVIITQGLLKMTYDPDEDTLTELDMFGKMPIKELLSNIHFKEPEEEYLFVGNTIGELSFLTKRPYACRIEAVRSTSGLIIPKAVLSAASDFNTDPIYGLYCRMWKHVSCAIMWRILMEKVHYQNIGITSLHLLMNRAFVPDTSHYHVLKVSNYIDDIILIDGTLTDSSTGEQYTAPCYIPRSVHQLELPRASVSKAQPKVVVIPRTMIDSYTVMQTTEDMSETIENDQTTAPIRNVQIRKLKRQLALDMFKNRDLENTVEKMRRSSLNETKIATILDYLSEKRFRAS